MPEPLTSNDLIRAAEFAALMKHAASREPLTDAETTLAEYLNSLDDDGPHLPGYGHRQSTRRLLAEVQRLRGYTSGFVLEGYRKGRAAALEAAAKLVLSHGERVSPDGGIGHTTDSLMLADAIRKMGD